MPYIKQADRNYLNPNIDILIERLGVMPLEEKDGAVNYVVTRLLHGVYQPRSYFSLNRALGVLTAVTHELYRRVVAPYEDEKIAVNGDIE